MSLKTFSRARLLALAGAILLGLALSVPTFHSSYAQAPAATAPAPDAAAPAAPAADAGPPACDGVKVTENCTPNSGDTAWMLTSMAIVLMMTIPGLALFYGGMVRKKNVGDTVMTSFAITCLISILWLFFTYSLAFRSGTPFIGGLDRAFLQNIISNTFNSAGVAQNIGTPNSLAPTIPESVYSMFQLTFAIITAALIAGSFAERMKFSAMLWFIGLWAIFVYSPIAHWVWGPDGIFNSAQRQGLGQSARFRRRHGGARQFRHRRPDGGADAGQAQGNRPAAQHGFDHDRRLAAVGRLVRLQRRLGGERRHAGRHGDAGHAYRHRHRRLHLDARSSG